MKKLVVFAVLGLFVSVTAFARVVVLQDGKMMTFADNSEISVSGKHASRVLYDGDLITVPANQKVKVEKKEGKIIVTGTNLKGIEIAGKSISSNGQAAIAVAPETMEISTISGDIAIVSNEVIFKGDSKMQNTVKVNKTTNTNNQQVAKTENAKVSVPATETVVFPEVSEYVNEVAAQQSAQDVIDTSDLSKSAPRS